MHSRNSAFASFSQHNEDMDASAAQAYLSLAGPATGPAAAGPAPPSLRPDELRSQHLEPQPPPLPPYHPSERHGCPRGRPAAGGCQTGRLKQHCSHMQLPGQCLLLSPSLHGCLPVGVAGAAPDILDVPLGHLQAVRPWQLRQPGYSLQLPGPC